MSTVVSTHKFELSATAVDAALRAVGRAWFVTAVVGQVVFAAAVASFYTATAARGTMPAWNRSMTGGYVAGDRLGNSAVALHLAAAVLIVVSGALQFAPGLRRKAPRLHRWSGRVYLASACAAALGGLFMLWRRGSVGDLSQHLGIGLDALLILLCAAMSLRAALQRRFAAHELWALRLFLVASGVWFFRIGLALSLVVFGGPVGFDVNTFTGPLLTFLAFGQSLLPLAALELYRRARDGASRSARLAVAGGLLGATLATGAGTLAATAIFWAPRIRAAYAPVSDGDRLLAAWSAAGIDEVAREHDRLTARNGAAGVPETALNSLGYQLLRAGHVADAVQVFELNVEAFPGSSNAHDSLAEACEAAGNAARAVTHYTRALELDPNRRSAALALARLTTH